MSGGKTLNTSSYFVFRIAVTHASSVGACSQQPAAGGPAEGEIMCNVFRGGVRAPGAAGALASGR